MTVPRRPGEARDDVTRATDQPRYLGRTVLALGGVSFLTDMSSEMIYPLLPVFLSAGLGASASFIGVIEGTAESLASLLKLASGWWSDRVRRRKPLVVAGYTIAALARPLVGVAQSAAQVLAIRLTDRVGKGLRTAPRDALIADSVHSSARGRAYGFHRAADHAGAVVGPLLAFVLLEGAGLSLRHVFLLAAVPGVLALVVLVLGVREPVVRRSGQAITAPVSAPPAGGDDAAAAPPTHTAPDLSQPLGGTFWRYLAVLLLFTLGNSTDAFLLLRASQLGVPVSLAPVLWAMLHVVKSAASTPGASLSDRLGRRPVIIAGWLLYAAVYLGFAGASVPWHAWALFAAYGIFFGLTEGTEKALVADLVAKPRRGAAFGWYNLTIGLAALPASLLFGAIWDLFGAPAAFTVGALLALGAAIGMMVLRTSPSRVSD